MKSANTRRELFPTLPCKKDLYPAFCHLVSERSLSQLDLLMDLAQPNSVPAGMDTSAAQRDAANMVDRHLPNQYPRPERGAQRDSPAVRSNRLSLAVAK